MRINLGLEMGLLDHVLIYAFALFVGCVCVCVCGVHVCVYWYSAIFAFEPWVAAHCRVVCLLQCPCLCAFVLC